MTDDHTHGGWQPIATAPRDGTKFLAYWPEGMPGGNGYSWEGIMAECCYIFEQGGLDIPNDDNEYSFDELMSEGLYSEDVRQWVCGPYSADEFDSDSPTHWMPLPAAPTGGE